jgi:hypothetical protein
MDAYENAQEQFKREKQAYWAMRDRLMKDYYGKWVAVVNGQVVGSGNNRGRVGYAAFLKTGSEVCFCAQVGFEDRILRVRQVASGYFGA